MLKNITLSAQEAWIEKARKRALKENKSLNSVFRDWLYRYAGIGRSHNEYLELMDRLSYVRPGRTFTRDEMNER